MKQRHYQLSTHKSLLPGLYFGAVWSRSGLRLVHVTTLQTSRHFARKKGQEWAEHSTCTKAKSLES